MTRRRPLKERFDEKHTPEPNSGCWLWTAATSPLGYGEIGRGGCERMHPAHRISWELHRGPIPEGMHVLHKCDVRCCVNPDHLFLGTHQDNMADRNRKGRQHLNRPRGEKVVQAKLTLEQAREIKNSKEPLRVLAARFGICQSAVSHVRTGRNWPELRD